VKILSTVNVSDWKTEDVCTQCATHVELLISDLHRVSDGRYGDFCTWGCPTCSHVNTLALTEIPKTIHHAIPLAVGYGGYGTKD